MTIELTSAEISMAGEDSLKRKLQGVLFFRLVLGLFLLALTLAVESRRAGDLLASHLQPLYFFSCILFVFTIVAALSLKRVVNLERFAYIQLLFDVAAVTVLIFLSGGVDSPYPFLYMPVIVCAALLLRRRASLLAASACSLCYGVLLDLQYFDWLSPLQVFAAASRPKDSAAYFYSIAMAIAAFYLVAYLSGYFARELQKSSRQVRMQRRDLRHLETLHRNIVQSMNSGLLSVTPTGYVRFCNRAAEEILDTPADQIYGRAFQKLFPSLDPHMWPESRNSTRKMPSPEGMSRKEVTYQKPSGDELCLGYTVSILQDERGDGAGWVFIFQDLTPVKAMEEHLHRMERMAFAGKIAAEIAHEIKNPLAAMSGAVQMLQAEAGDSMQVRLMGIVEREIGRIDELVTDFLWLSRGARKTEKAEEVSAGAVIQEIISLLGAKEKIVPGQKVWTNFKDMPTFLMDPHHFRQILWNLFVNALEAMPDGGDLTLSMSILGNGNGDRREGRIDVSDTGCGIPEEIKERVFEPFFTTKKTGTGLGLSIVYQLVENAGGRMAVAQNEGAGTTFSLFFPLSTSFPLAK